MTTRQGPAAIGWAILWPAGLAMGLVALWFAALEPVFSFMARSPITAIVGLGAGWTAIAVGLTLWRRQPDNGAGPLLAAADSPGSWSNGRTRPVARPRRSQSAWSWRCLPTVGLPRRPVLPSRTARIRWREGHRRVGVCHQSPRPRPRVRTWCTTLRASDAPSVRQTWWPSVPIRRST